MIFFQPLQALLEAPPAGSRITPSRKIFPLITRSRKSSKFVHHAKITKYRQNHASRLKFLPYHASRQNANHAITPKNMPNHAITPKNTPNHAITQTAGGASLSFIFFEHPTKLMSYWTVKLTIDKALSHFPYNFLFNLIYLQGR